MTSPRFPEPPAAIPPTPRDRIDAALDRVSKQKDAWTRVTLARRIEYLEACLKGTSEVAEAWVADGCRRKGVEPGSQLEGEEWLAGPMTTLRNIRLLIDALKAGGRPAYPRLETRADGQLVAHVFPASLHDRLMMGGVSAEVWMEPGKQATQGAIYRKVPESGKVALVLGAGNVSSIPPMDVLYKLFVEDEVCILKMNPVNADVGPHLEKAFASLIDDGYLAVLYGGAEVGGYLADHPKVDTLHVTGSDRTYDAIVWGSDPDEQARRKAEHAPKNSRRFTAELGCVTPVMVVPGNWSEDEIDYQARHIAGMVTQNASFNCNAAKVLVVAKGWPQREAFLQRVEKHLAAAQQRKAYYPGAQQRYDGFVSKYPQARPAGERSGDIVPWTFIPNVPAKKGEYALTNEAFCGVLAEVSLDASDAETFIKKAVAFANDDCWGTLSCTVLVHPKTEATLGPVLDRAIADLRFGGIGINIWPGVIYGLVVTTWGAFPGHPPEDIQSGAGVVHNSFLFDHPQKSVVRAPFVVKPTLPYFADHRSLRDLGRALTRYEGEATWGNLARVALAGLKG